MQDQLTPDQIRVLKNLADKLRFEDRDMLRKEPANQAAGAQVGSTLTPVDALGRDLDRLFRYHAPRTSQLKQYNAVRMAAKYFAEVVFANVPNVDEREGALNYIRLAMMLSNAGIAVDGSYESELGGPGLGVRS